MIEQVKPKGKRIGWSEEALPRCRPSKQRQILCSVPLVSSQVRLAMRGTISKAQADSDSLAGRTEDSPL
jgi:hypothetical protein